MTVQSATRVWVEKIPKKFKKSLRKGREVFLSGKKDLKQLQKTERNIEKPKTYKALPVESPVLL